MMYVLVRPLGGLTNCAPFLSAGFPSACHMRRMWLKAVNNDVSEVFDALIFGFLNPGCAPVGTVVCFPVMRAVDLINGQRQVFI